MQRKKPVGPRPARTKRASAAPTSSLKSARNDQQRAMSEFWEVHEFARLAAGLDWDAKEVDLNAATVGRVRAIEAMANRSLQGKTLRHHAAPDEWIRWAEALAIAVPSALKDAVKKHRPLPVPASKEDAATENGSTTKSGLTKQRNTMLRIIGGMAKAEYGLSLENAYESGEVISKKLAAIDIQVSSDTIATYLKEAARLLAQERLKM